jgi:hypothetical protein
VVEVKFTVQVGAGPVSLSFTARTYPPRPSNIEMLHRSTQASPYHPGVPRDCDLYRAAVPYGGTTRTRYPLGSSVAKRRASPSLYIFYEMTLIGGTQPAAVVYCSSQISRASVVRAAVGLRLYPVLQPPASTAR